MSPATTAETVNIASHLTRMAASQPQAPAIVFLKRGRESRLAFGALDADSDAIARGLERLGLRRGSRAAVLVKPGRDFFALTFALFKLGAVPVLIDPGLGRSGLGRCLAEAAPEAFIGIPLAHLARILFGWGRATLKTLVVAGPGVFPGARTLDEVRRLGRSAPGPGGPYVPAPTRPEETAAILFTSGSTGSPKGAVYSHGNFAAQVELLGRHFSIEPGEVDLPTFPLFALFDPALGMTAVIPEMDFTRPGSVEPENILGPIRRYSVTHLFGSPALLDRVGRYAEARDIRLPSLKRVVSAGAPVAPKILERFARLLGPGVEVHTPYGATEALPVSSIGSAEVLGDTRRGTVEGRGICVGRPLPGVDLQVVRIDDGPLPAFDPSLAAPPGEIGELVARGPQVTLSYWGRPDADALAKIRFPDGSIGHRMGDLGYLDPQGRLWFCGRKSQRVVTEHGPLYTIPCEGVFNRHPYVRRCALVGVGAPGRQRPVIIVERERAGPPISIAKLRAELLQLGARHEHTRSIQDVLFRAELPTDIRHNAKIFREKLAVWAAARVR